ncbi:MAG: YihY family inner membrane protein [Spartobacteria bacterium]|nr:YihY family inner membrane protein [Spartobacteria bacterium]
MIDRSKNYWKQITQFLFHDVWEIEISSMSALRRSVVRFVRVAQLVVRGVREDELPVHASSLTYAALMSLVPMCGIVFAILKGLGFGESRINELLQWTEEMPVEFQNFVEQLRSVASGTNFAALGWIGVIFLMFTAIMVLGSIENSFNRIWGIKRSRNYIRRIANYISILVVVPILVGAATTVAATLRSEVMLIKLSSVAFLYRHLLTLMPILSAWLAFGFLYTMLPNTRVRFSSAFISGLVGALLWLSWQKVYISLQLGVARYNEIYGVFAMIPIFLAWLYVSWIIVLLGAEVAFAVQNESTYHLERSGEKASLKARAAIGLAVLERTALALEGAASSFEISAFARERKVPVRLLNDVIGFLVQAGWLVEVSERSGNYVLVKAPEKIPMTSVFERLMNEGITPRNLGIDHLGGGVDTMMLRLDEGMQQSMDGMTLEDMISSRA